MIGPYILYPMNFSNAEKIYLGIGGNQGAIINTIDSVIESLLNHSKIAHLQISRYYLTSPVGGPPQGHYINAVIAFDTLLEPLELLHFTQSIEQKLGKQKKMINGPRTIDIDILFFGNRIIEEKNLQVPHPRFQNRLFVLKPLHDLINQISTYKCTFEIDQLLKDFINTNSELVLPIDECFCMYKMALMC
ncbi:MAG: 2-amino-4-hydroxy-6-hydroxymethyldihydropteridine diphosphokinase [Parachlamydiales bacterium]|nr:2-amino-4-hydroxy-6-hydroxymethyldihydropteridine diphosphokinase [Parachlamydiales bacterium]